MSSMPGVWPTRWANLVNHLVASDTGFQAVYSLRQRACTRTASSFPPGMSWGDEFDKAFNSRIFLLKEACEPVGTVRVMFGGGPDRLPTALSGTFRKELEQAIGAAFFVEATGFTICYSKSATDTRYVLALMQNITAEADAIRARYIVVPIYSSHMSFYATLGFRMISCEKFVPGWPQAVILGCMDWLEERNRLSGHTVFSHLFSARNAI